MRRVARQGKNILRPEQDYEIHPSKAYNKFEDVSFAWIIFILLSPLPGIVDDGTIDLHGMHELTPVRLTRWSAHNCSQQFAGMAEDSHVCSSPASAVLAQGCQCYYQFVENLSQAQYII
jgi:hypothetical protein